MVSTTIVLNGPYLKKNDNLNRTVIKTKFVQNYFPADHKGQTSSVSFPWLQIDSTCPPEQMQTKKFRKITRSFEL